jgi:hypothetical protein
MKMMPGSDFDSSDMLWRLVHLVQGTIDKDGRPLLVDADDGSYYPLLADIRKLADELDPDNGKY